MSNYWDDIGEILSDYPCCLCDGTGRTEFAYTDFEALLTENVNLRAEVLGLRKIIEDAWRAEYNRE